jgi:tRNA pseudouridine32 synthase / 23S rRNA pseudouridine746 synthase
MPQIMKYITNSRSENPSFITLPPKERPDMTILQYLQLHFPHIDRQIWLDRINDGLICSATGASISLKTAYKAGMRLSYFREKQKEIIIPFEEIVLFQNDHLVAVCKPHFLPVQPTGPYVAECLLNRLIKSLGNRQLVPLHRIDRETAGVVLFSANPDTRNIYHKLFATGKIKKIYEAIGTAPEDKIRNEWLVENRIEESEKWPMMRNAEGPVNARTLIRKVDEKGEWAKFEIEPFTGKGHQIRLHLQVIGSSILNDRYHPELQPEQPDDFQNPLQLLAKQMIFTDPISGDELNFTSSRKLFF